MNFAIALAENGYLPDAVVRGGIRALLRLRLLSEAEKENPTDLANFVDLLKKSPLVVNQDKANSQHYEVPTAFYETVLGSRKKYSSCFWPEGTESLEAAEEEALILAAERAELTNSMKVLDLGCGWGSFSLWAAERYPGSEFLAVSNSLTQRDYIEAQAKQKGLSNLTVLQCDVNDFEPRYKFDRVVSIEMFEHLRNYEELLSRISAWLKSSGKLFVHIFCHRKVPYIFETEGATNWMGKYFFTGGMMPSRDLLPAFQRDLQLTKSWTLNGRHYSKTLEAWLNKLDSNRKKLEPVFEEEYGALEAKRWINRWRIFFMACSELFSFRSGDEWFVCHYLFEKPSRN